MLRFSSQLSNDLENGMTKHCSHIIMKKQKKSIRSLSMIGTAEERNYCFRCIVKKRELLINNLNNNETTCAQSADNRFDSSNSGNSISCYFLLWLTLTSHSFGSFVGS